MDFTVISSEEFAKLFPSLDADARGWIRKIIVQLKTNPDVGKPLGFKWFREKKFKDKRLYYLVYPDIKKVLIAAFAGKKEQKKIIAYILQNLGRYNRLAGLYN